MQGQRARKASRSLLFAAVLGAHALFVALLILASDTVQPPRESALSISAVMLLPARRRPVHFAPPRLRPIAVHTARTPAPITLVLPAVDRPIRSSPAHWAESARLAVQAVLRRRRRIAFGFPAGAHSRHGLHSKASGIRSQGRQSYRTDTGEHVARGSGNCYVVSAAPPLDASWLEQQAQMSRVQCSGRSRGPSPDNLFKDLPAYQRYHSLPSDALPRRRRKPRRPPPGGSG